MTWLTANGIVISAIAELVRQVRGTTLQLLDAADRTSLTWTPPGTSNHMLWHAGHAAWVIDALIVVPVTGQSELPAGFAERFGMGSQPSNITDWPDVTEVYAQLETQAHRVVELLLANAEGISARMNAPSSEGNLPLVPGMIHACHDEARHQGEMMLLQKLWRAGD